jgi:chorismate-pyruvate lyase
MQVKPDWNLIYPLSEFYEQSGLSLPSVARVEGQDIPAPYRSLLVHEHDMTPTLEDAYRRSIKLRVLQYQVRDHVVSRQVALIAEGSEKPVAFGAIKIDLEHFPTRARRLVLERQQPLGTILRAQGVEHTSHPNAFVRVTSDVVINGALQLSGSYQLFGRRNVILDSEQRTLAQVVEILPPSNGNLHPEKDREKR